MFNLAPRVILPLVTSLTNEFFVLSENVLPLKDLFIFDTSNFLSFFVFSDNFVSVNSLNENSSATKILINFINQLESAGSLRNFENTNAVYHYSIPNVKLWYPEPFIASPSFMHSDLWFMHILIYQYWLWFVFIFIIVFFFVTFISTVRWCNMRVRPRKETRGVSRSKCGDLITACVPVTWATSIIVNESTDAIDFYDGFGTTELVVGIRAYQWGWEYYYPKDVDLNYNIKNSYSSYEGNSLKYNKTTDVGTNYNNFWKFYQNKSTDQIISAAHLIMIPVDDYKIFNVLNFNDSGSNPTLELNSFKKTKIFSKFNKNDLFYQPYKLFLNYAYLNNLYFNSSELSDSLYLGTKNQNSYLPLQACLNNQTTFLNLKLSTKFYNLNRQNSVTNLFNLKFPVLLKFIKKTPSVTVKTFQNEIKFIKSSLNPLSNDFKSYLESTKYTDVSNKFLLISNNFKDISLKFFKLNEFQNEAEAEFSKLYLQNYENWPLTERKYKNTSITTNAEKLVWPILSTNLFIEPLKFDSFNTAVDHAEKNTNSGLMFTNYYWNFFWSFSQLNWKVQSNKFFLSTAQKFYIPNIALYYDYDFRNWQFLQYVEDSIWESVLSAYIADEYENVANEYYNDEYIDKIEKIYFKINEIPFKPGYVLNESVKTEDWVADDIYANPTLLEDNSSQFSLLNTKDFNLYANCNANTLVEDSYENLKNNIFLYNTFGKYAFILNTNLNFVHHHAFVLDSFRSDFETFAWFFDENNLSVELTQLNGEFYDSFLKSFIGENYLARNELVKIYELDSNADVLDYSYELAALQTSKFTDGLNNRLGAKGSILNFNALSKVFRPRFDEGRSHAKLDDFSYSYGKQQFISSFKTNYEKIIGKTHENFFKINLFKNNFKLNYNYNYDLNSSLNYFIFDFPFLLGLKSDASKYFWFDWYAKWGFYEVQPSSSSKYAIFGMPYFNKPFEFQQQFSLELNESENYLTRISRARRNYITNWTQTPYLFAKNSSWYLNNYIFEIFEEIDNDLLISQNLIEVAVNSVDTANFTSFKKLAAYHFHPSHSGTTTYTRSDMRPKHSIQSYYYSASQLVDILSKREYLYRELMMLNKKIVALPSALTASPNNPILGEIKTSFLYADPINLNNEYSRSIYLSSAQYFNYLIFKSFLINAGEGVDDSNFKTFIFSFLTNFNTDLNAVNSNFELYKNQYRPMRRSVANMIRLHATGAVAVPTEIRLQLLASSKDVIHSWAVPSAGIKIDCVPGYSSHKVFLFLLSGIFWGQCMEICGRYHHWMPIVVYFMKRDLFFLWCTHFAYTNNYNLTLPINDRQYADYSKQVSYSKYSWINELL